MSARRNQESLPRREAAWPERFVGRERELAEVEAGLGDVLSARGRLFFFAGEPGIGKTRLAEEAANEASRRGARVLWGRAWEAEGAPPYWPWIQILRGLVEDTEADVLRARLGAGLPWVAQLVPELRQVLPEAAEAIASDAGGGLSPDPARQRFHLFDAVTRFIVHVVAARSHVLVLDDLQWADVPSLLLLRFLVREIKTAPVLILGTYRDVEARSEKQMGEILASLAREGQVVHLGGLSEPEVGRLVAAWDRERATDDLISSVYRTTEGNPFFVDGILRLLAAEPPVDGAPRKRTTLPIPDEVRGAVRQRLARLPEELRELLTVGAILGRELEQEALVSVSGLSAEKVVSLLEEAGGLALLAGTTILHRWRFTHDLFREVLYGDLPAEERMKLHERVGAALESFYGERADEHAPELALHFFSALPRGDAEKAIRYGKLAARQAMSSYAWEDAVVELDRVLAALESDLAASERERLELLLDLGDALWHSEDPERYREVFGEAIDLARKLSLPCELARAVVGFLGAAEVRDVPDEGRVHLVDEALSALGEADLVLRGRLLVRLFWETFSPDHDFRKPAEECVEVARRAGEPVLLVHALRLFHTALFGLPQHLSERGAVADEMLEVARRTGIEGVILTAERVRIVDLFEAGDLASLDAEIASHHRRARRIREPTHLWHSTFFLASRALMSGDWEAAERFSAEARSAGLVTQKENATIAFVWQRYWLRYEQGRLVELVPSIRKRAARFPSVLVWRVPVAVAYSDLGRTREAQTELEVLAANDLENLPDDYMLPHLLAQLSIVVSFLGDTARAGVIYGRLLPFAGLNILFGWAAACLGAADRYLGLLASTLSSWADAERHFEAALEMNRRMGMGPTVARTQYDYASMLLRRGGPEDAAKAETLLREAAAAARDFGMARVLERADEALAKLGASAGEASNGDTAAAGGATADAAVAILRREGDFWTIGWHGKVFRLRDLKGLGYIQRLVAEPGRELHCVDIAGDEAVDLGDAGEVLDVEAKAAYRGRVDDLRDELAEAESNNDSGRAAKAREEMERLGEELASAVGLGGRDRRAARNLERARIRVTRAIRDAVTRIRQHDASLGHHLSTAIKTGAFCSYTPDPTSPITWRS